MSVFLKQKKKKKSESDEIKKLVGHNLRFFRKFVRLSQRDLAYALDISVPQLCYVERGYRSMNIEIMLRFIDMLETYRVKVTIDDFLKVREPKWRPINRLLLKPPKKRRKSK